MRPINSETYSGASDIRISLKGETRALLISGNRSRSDSERPAICDDSSEVGLNDGAKAVIKTKFVRVLVCGSTIRWRKSSMGKAREFASAVMSLNRRPLNISNTLI